MSCDGAEPVIVDIALMVYTCFEITSYTYNLPLGRIRVIEPLGVRSSTNPPLPHGEQNKGVGVSSFPVPSVLLRNNS